MEEVNTMERHAIDEHAVCLVAKCIKQSQSAAKVLLAILVLEKMGAEPTREKIAELLDYPEGTVGYNLWQLMSRRIVRTETLGEPRRGRPRHVYRVTDAWRRRLRGCLEDEPCAWVDWLRGLVG